jgi:putative transposase
MLYLAAIIDRYSKAILSYPLSNSMNTSWVMNVFNDTINRYGSPDIFNTVQGSQYTSERHTQALKNKGSWVLMVSKKLSLSRFNKVL